MSFYFCLKNNKNSKNITKTGLVNSTKQYAIWYYDTILVSKASCKVLYNTKVLFSSNGHIWIWQARLHIHM